MIPFDTIKDLFFEIEIAPRSESLKKKNKKFIKLPEFLKRSVESMEVALVAEERGGAGATMTINFKERVMVAPQEQEALVKSGIVSGKSGYWLDLKFAEENSEEKYTLFTNSDLNKTYRQKRKESLESYKSTNKNLKDWQLDEIAEELEILDKELNYSKNNYILSPGNTIRLSWGYKGKLQSWQTAEYTVIMVKHNDSGSVPTTSVQCVDFTIAYLDYVTPFSGFSCTKEEIAAYLNKQNKIETESRSYKNKPATRYEVLQAICDMNNIDLYIGDLSLKEELQKENHKLNQHENIPATVTFKDYLDKLSAGTDLTYFIEPKLDDDNKPLTLFLYKLDYLKGHPVFTFIWKNHINSDSIDRNNIITNGMESWDLVHGSENSIVGESGVNSQNKTVQNQIGTPEFFIKIEQIYGKKEAEEAKKIYGESKTTDIARARFIKKYGKDKVTKLFGGTGGYHPRSETFTKNDSTALANALAGGVIKIGFTHVGYPSLVPCQCEILGISDRHSGLYWLQSVKHIISPAQGYICQCEARSVAKGGRTPIFKSLPKESKGDTKLRVGKDKNDHIDWEGRPNVDNNTVPANIIKTYKEKNK